MPIYEYQCRKCREVTEKIQGISDPPIRKCPACGGRLEKVMSPGAFILKGPGFYANDYAGKGNGDGKKSPACPAAGGGKSPACAGCPKAE